MDSKLHPNHEWIHQYEGHYAACPTGRIYSYKKEKPIMLSHSDNRGYQQVSLYKDGKRKSAKVHRLVAQTFLPNPNNKEDVNHDDFDKTNNSVENLTWMTHFENMDHYHSSKK